MLLNFNSATIFYLKAQSPQTESYTNPPPTLDSSGSVVANALMI